MPQWIRDTLKFFPLKVLISASLPMVKELVTVFPGVFVVTTKSLPVCWISVTGLTSLACSITSSGSAEWQSRTQSSSVLPTYKCSWLSGVLTYGPEELLVVLLSINLPCSTECHSCRSWMASPSPQDGFPKLNVFSESHMQLQLLISGDDGQSCSSNH